LKNRFSDCSEVEYLQAAVTENNGEVEFYAPTEEATQVYEYADQLGSLNPNHATEHHTGLCDKIEKVKVKAVTFQTLVREFGITSVRRLITDVEGYDAKILVSFPFGRLKPEIIIFEHKHCDGVSHMGRNFARLITTLDGEGYKTKVIGLENCVALLDGVFEQT
jgi:FkbM family methyltransferase